MSVSIGMCGLEWITRKSYLLSAREKLNSVYFGIAAFVAGVLGIATGSIVVFLVSLAILTGVMLNDGSIRLPKGGGSQD